MTQKFTLVARILLGLVFTASAIAGLTGQLPPPEGPEAQAFMGTLFGSGLLVFVKFIELFAGLALISGFFAPLALVVLAPIIVNILYFHLSLDPVGIPVGIMLAVLAMVVAHGYRNVFLPLLQPRMKRNEDASVGVSAI